MVSRRGRAWADFLVGHTLSTSQISFDLLADLNAPETVTMTVVRIVGRILATPASANSALESLLDIDMGIQVVSQEAFAAGVLPDPNTQSDYPAAGWLYRNRVGLYHQNTSGTVEGYHYPLLTFDIRAARKVDRGRLVLTINKGVIDGSDQDVNLVGIVRSLALT